MFGQEKDFSVKNQDIAECVALQRREERKVKL
jgi:hypothetical protein